MGNLLNSEDGVVKNCCNFTGEDSYDHQEETYKIALKQDAENVKRKSSVNRTQTPYSIKPQEADNPQLDSQTSFSFANVVE
mmetsp:Transcript_51726/g.46432  ORF Transcript_51726/g.46432 Transcript_51726/m.46432 type:complete len:81 (+) Transcript_51726:114-356(+)